MLPSSLCSKSESHSPSLQVVSCHTRPSTLWKTPRLSKYTDVMRTYWHALKTAALIQPIYGTMYRVIFSHGIVKGYLFDTRNKAS